MNLFLAFTNRPYNFPNGCKIDYLKTRTTAVIGILPVTRKKLINKIFKVMEGSRYWQCHVSTCKKR
jgi:hypothetical protein